MPGRRCFRCGLICLSVKQEQCFASSVAKQEHVQLCHLCDPSLSAQLKQLQGGHGLASVLHQVPAVDGLSLPAFETGPKGQLQLAEGPPGGVAQFSFELVKAVHVGPTGDCVS